MSTINIPRIFPRIYVAISARFAVMLNSFAKHFDNYSGLKMHPALNQLPFSIFSTPTTEPVKVRVINHANVTKTQRNHYG